MSLPSTGNTQRTLYFGQYEEELPTNQTVTWASLVASTAYTSSNILHKTGSNSAWDAGAISTQSIASSSGGGYVSVVADATDRDRMFGLGNSNVNADYTDLEYGLHLMDNGTMEILESGSNKGNVGSYSVGDVLKVAVVSAVVKYYRNDTLLYSSKITPSYPLYLDTSIYTPGANLVGALLCVGSACLASPTTPPYTSYYSFGGKLVGMRRANYSASGSNGQFRVVGDHLGSTTLVVDTANPPNVVQRQYHKPYGETAFQYTAASTGSASLTNVGYTGQRTDEDSTGLMFYNARVYDPVLAFFVSADSIAAKRNVSESRNRYGYVLNNPLSFTDPSGHNPTTPLVDGDSCTSEVGCQQLAEQTLKDNFGVDVDDKCPSCRRFSSADLEILIEALEDLLKAAEWDYDDFKRAMQTDTGDYIILRNQDFNPDLSMPWREPIVTGQSGLNNGKIWALDMDAMHKAGLGRTNIKSWAVHEVAHVWDYMNKLSESMEIEVGWYSDPSKPEPYPSKYASQKASDGRYDEVFAEVVAAIVYPNATRFLDTPIASHGLRAAYVRKQFNKFKK